MDTLQESLNAAISYLQSGLSNLRNTVDEYVEQTNELFYSYDANSERSLILEEIMNSEDAWELAINLIARDQLLDQQITPWHASMPEYKPRTIRHKIQRGFPPEWRVRYTEYDTGAFYNYGINLIVDRQRMEYWMGIHNIDRFPYFAYIPEEYIDFTPENLEYFESTIGSWLNQRLVEEWLERETR